MADNQTLAEQSASEKVDSSTDDFEVIVDEAALSAVQAMVTEYNAAPCGTMYCGTTTHPELVHDADPDASVYEIIDSIEQRT